jgi:hypothetical protein
LSASKFISQKRGGAYLPYVKKRLDRGERRQPDDQPAPFLNWSFAMDVILFIGGMGVVVLAVIGLFGRSSECCEDDPLCREIQSGRIPNFPTFH